MNGICESTVAAISTPYGRGGIAVIRISGADAIAIGERIFACPGGKKLSGLPSNRACYGRIMRSGEVIDDGMATVFRAPASYTGEDTVEISCHGGILISGEVLSAAFEAGAMPAGPGEFTKRAFINGKLSLSQAEAVIDLIDAETHEAAKLARANASGAVSSKVDGIYDRLRHILAQAYVYADYPDEDLTDITPDEMKKGLISAREDALALYASYRTGRAISEGIYTVIIGRANSGKSSLLNRLSGRERAIVSDIEGTTRDFIEETVSAGRVTLRLCDTAGIRKSGDAIEREGISRSFARLEQAELVIALFDGSRECSDDDLEIIEKLKDCGARRIAVVNKCDLERRFHADLSSFDSVYVLSAAAGEGVDVLKEGVEALFAEGNIDYNSTPIVSSARQAAALGRAAQALERAIDALESGLTQDVAGLDVEQAMAALGETDGRTVGMDIVDDIFHRFCVGK